MTHEHHHHEHTVTSLNKAFILGIALNVAFVVVEFAVGLSYGSMGLLSDAGHNLSDVASLLLAMLAFRLAQAQATPRYTYGYKKSTVLISLLNSVILLIAVGSSSPRASAACCIPRRSKAAPSPGRRASGWRSTASRRGCF